MDGSRFDAVVRELGERRTRRGVVGLLAALAAGGAARDADARKRRRRCNPACGPQQACVDRQCTCPGGGTVCGANCCLLGQECRDGQCVELPEPVTCIAYGEPCKGVGKPCCEGLACGSGQGGESDVACYVRKTGRCTSTAECTFGTECVDGICVGPPICNVQLGETCGPEDTCCVGICAPGAIIGGRIPVVDARCCVGLGQACSRDNDCCGAYPDAGRVTVGVQCVSGACTISIPPPP